jgi:hypothetical protein
MSDIIDFLENVGRDARLRHAQGAALQSALAAAGIGDAVRIAITDGDPLRLQTLLGANPNVCCLVEEPKREEDDAPLLRQ